MAKNKVEVVKSDEVKRVLAESPGATAKEVVETLKEQGINISDALVYAVKEEAQTGQEGTDSQDDAESHHALFQWQGGGRGFYCSCQGCC